MVRVTIGSVMALVVFACAGQSVSGDGSNGDDTGGSAGTTVGSGGTGGTTSTGGIGGTVSTGAAPATGGRASGGRGGTASGGRGGSAGSAGTAGVVDPICALPPDPGPCEGYDRSYAFDTETGLCLPFIYGGCEGNANNFETAEDCYGACDGAGVGGTAYCDASVECHPISTRCCACSGFAFENVVGVNSQHMPIIEATKCAAVDCDACAFTSGLEWFGASCRENHCVAWDAREEELTLCMTDADCQLRNGLGCCEACEPGAATIAVNASLVPLWVCPDGQPPCPSCPNGGPTYPGFAFAACVNSRCAVYLE